MATNASAITTAEQLCAANLEDPCELVRGELVMMSPAFGYHGSISNRIAHYLTAHVIAKNLGDVFYSDTGYLIERDPDTLRAADVSFIPLDRLEELDHINRFFPFAPDLAVEVVSTNDRPTDVAAKARQWLECGTKLVMVVEPQTHVIRVYSPSGESQRFGIESVIDASAAVPGWKLSVRDAFPAMYDSQ